MEIPDDILKDLEKASLILAAFYSMSQGYDKPEDADRLEGVTMKMIGVYNKKFVEIAVRAIKPEDIKDIIEEKESGASSKKRYFYSGDAEVEKLKKDLGMKTDDEDFQQRTS